MYLRITKPDGGCLTQPKLVVLYIAMTKRCVQTDYLIDVLLINSSIVCALTIIFLLKKEEWCFVAASLQLTAVK
jgi:hypothetical protein